MDGEVGAKSNHSIYATVPLARIEGSMYQQSSEQHLKKTGDEGAVFDDDRGKKFIVQVCFAPNEQAPIGVCFRVL